MSRTCRNEAEFIEGIKRYARSTGRQARKMRHARMERRINTRAAQIMEDRAEDRADSQIPDAKPQGSFLERWRLKKWSFL